VPWVVQVDNLGQAQAVAPADGRLSPTDPQIAWHLARFIEQVRSIPADPIIVRQNWLRAYDFTTDRARWRSTTMPAPTIRSPRSASSRSRSRCRASSAPRRQLPRRLDRAPLSRTAARRHERWTAILTIAVQTPRDADALLRANPLGIYVNAINWSRCAYSRQANARRSCHQPRHQH
jgi:type IV secretory pathway TrbF-like protein